MSDSEPIKTHIECHLCGSSDAGAVYTDGHFHCFSCRGTEQSYSGERLEEVMPYMDTDNTVIQMPSATQRPQESNSRLIDMLNGLSCSVLPDRKIAAAVVEKYGVKVDNVTYRHLYPYRDRDGVLQGIKTRYIRNKTFSCGGTIYEEYNNTR